MSEVATYSSATSLVPHNMNEAIRLAEFMASARTVPKHLWDSPGDCLMVVELAMRWGMSPFAVAQATSVISGKQMIEGKLVAAAVENSGAIVGHIDYDFAGEGEGRSITVTATRRGETNPRTVTVAYKDARTNNEMWKRQPDQQLVYHGARVWARRWTPAVILGVYSREEMGPIIEGEATEHAASDERAAINDAVPLKPAAASTPRAERKVDPTVYETPPKSTPPANGKPRHSVAPPPGAPDVDWRACLDWVAPAMAKLRTRQHVVDVANGPTCSDIIAHGPGWAKAELDELLNENYRRFPEPEGEELPDIEIAGEEKVMSG